MQDWDDDVDLDEWGEGPRREPSRVGLVVVALFLLVPFVYVYAGGASAVDALGPGLVAVVVFFALVAVAYLAVRRWLRRRLVDDSFWSDRR